MPLVWKQLINALTMVCPMLCLIKRRTSSPGQGKHAKRLLRIMNIHIPVSMMYHLSMFFGRLPKGSAILQITDFFLIHVSSIVALPRRHRPILVASHGVIWLDSCVRTHCPLPKMLAIIMSTKHLLDLDKCVAKKVSFSGLLAYLLYAFDEAPIKYGHAMFHVTLYWVYNYYFDLLRILDTIK